MVDSDLVQLECPVCGESNWQPALVVRRASLSKCARCGLLATTSFLQGASSTDALYDVTQEDRRVYEADYLPRRLESYRAGLPLLEHFRKDSRLLEVGSGYGDFLLLAAEQGWEAEGIEISSYAATVSRGRGCRVHTAGLEAACLASETYDVIIMWDVIEHFLKPRPIVEACSRLLRPGGALMMKTPDGRALTPNGGLVRTLYRHLAYPANTPEHVFHYTPEHLKALLSTCGFITFSVKEEDEWGERVISGRNAVIRGVRLMLMRYAHARRWPYEFLLIAQKA